MKKIFVFVLVILALTAGPVFGQNDKLLKVKYRPVVENILQSLDRNNYKTFIKDMDEQMRARMTKDVFKKKRTALTAQVGKMENLQYMGHLEKNEVIILIWKVRDIKNNVDVMITIAIKKDAKGKTISGLGFG